MKALLTSLLAICVALTLSSCSTPGASAPPPTDVTVVPGDGVITISWTATPGVNYWIFSAAETSISTDNWVNLKEARAITSATSPYVLTGLKNGATYSITVNGRINGGPGGAGSPSISTIPRLAGAVWNAGASINANDLRGVAYGTQFVAVGANGAALSSIDGKTWITQSSGVTTTLNAAVRGGSYLAAGTGGTILLSNDAVTWVNETSNTTNDLYGLAANGSFYLAVGANGTIITSNGGATWSTAPVSGTSNPLYGVAYGVVSGVGRYVAVGANGTLLYSTDAVTWQNASLSATTTTDLKSVAYGVVGADNIGTFVALGGAGTVLTSIDGVNWTVRPAIASNPTINAVKFGSQFVAVGDGGAIFTSTDGITWATATSVTPTNSNNLYAVAYGNHGYTSVGAAGANLTAY